MYAVSSGWASRSLGGLMLALLFLMVPGLEATTYYVATSGGGGCSTSSSSPSGSVGNSVNCLGPGDTLYFLAGTYNVAIRTPPSGNSTNRVTIAGAPGQSVLLRQDGSGALFDFNSGVSYITIDNFRMDGAGINFIVRNDRGGHHIRIQNSELFGSDKSAILTNNTGSEFINLHIHDLGTTDLDHGIYQEGDHTLMKNNHIHHTAGFGIQSYNGSFDVVSNNTIVGNVIHDNPNAAGILLSSGDNNIAYNNIVYNNYHGFKIWLGGVGNQVYNNTIYDNISDCVYNEQDNLTFQNNICYANGGVNGINNNANNPGSVSQSNNLLGTNPQFVNAGAGNFHLNANSPAIGAGATLGAVTTDKDGVARTPPYDIGAYETGGVVIPPLPQNLRVHWPMEETTGTTVNDVTGNGYTATFHDLPTRVPGRIGARALHFSTAETYILGLPLVDPVTQYTWHLWLNSDQPVTTAMQQPFLHGAGTASTDGNAVSFGFSWSHPTAGAEQACLQREADSTIARAQILTPLSPGVWYHIAGSWDGTTMKCYLNGIPQASTPVPSLITPEGNIGVGKTFVGSIDDVYIYSKVLTDAEILAAASAGASTTNVRHRAVRQ